MPASYSLRPLAKHLSREELTALAWAAMDACKRRYQMCLMYSRHEALYVFPDGHSILTDQVPHGGVNPPFYPPELDFLPGPVWYGWSGAGKTNAAARERQSEVDDGGND